MEHEFKTYVRTGDQLRHFAAPVKKYNTRECFGTLCDFVVGEQQDKVFILYGLRRTGKTTMIRQAILKMTDEHKNQTAFIQIGSKETDPEIRMSSPFMTHYYLEALYFCGQAERAIEYIKEYWGAIIAAGFDCCPECFDLRDEMISPYRCVVLNSACHAWSCTPSYWIRKYYINGDI